MMILSRIRILRDISSSLPGHYEPYTLTETALDGLFRTTFATIGLVLQWVTTLPQPALGMWREVLRRFRMRSIILYCLS